MRIISVLMLLSMLFVAAACGLGGQNGGDSTGTRDKPPTVFVEIGDEKYGTVLGTYCWSGDGEGRCVDTVGPVELLEGKDPIRVRPGEKISFVIDGGLEPSEVHVEMMRENDRAGVEVEVVDDAITAPLDGGIYYYSYGAWWSDEGGKGSRGDAFYVFGIEVVDSAGGEDRADHMVVESELVASEKTLPDDFYDVADKGVLVRKVLNQEKFNEQWGNYGLSGELPAIDWSGKAVIFLGVIESGSCPVELGSVTVNEGKTEMRIHLKVEEERPCTEDATPRTIVFAVDAEELKGVKVVRIDHLFGSVPEVGFE